MLLLRTMAIINLSVSGQCCFIVNFQLFNFIAFIIYYNVYYLSSIITILLFRGLYVVISGLDIVCRDFGA